MRVTGIDIGGKTVKYGLTENAALINKGSLPTPRSLTDLYSAINKIIASFDADAVGIGIPGLVDGGTILNAPNLEIKNVDFLSNLKVKNAVLINDAEAAMVAEATFGAAKDSKYAALITIGTGIGGAILIDGKLYRGNGGAAEFGHMLTYGSFPCLCGLNGCFETVASASALERQFTSLSDKTLTAEEIFNLSDSGDKLARKLTTRYITSLGNGILSLANILRPEIFVIGGGVSERKTALISPLKEYVKAHNYGYVGARAFDIVAARFYSEAGIIGAAEYARTIFSE